MCSSSHAQLLNTVISVAIWNSYTWYGSFFSVGIFHLLVVNTSPFLIIVTDINYYLAVIPFLAAVEAGLFGQLQYQIEILPPEEQRADFCYSVADCRSQVPNLMDEWKAYFEVNNFTWFFFSSYFLGNDTRILPLQTIIAVICKIQRASFLFSNSLK